MNWPILETKLTKQREGLELEKAEFRSGGFAEEYNSEYELKEHIKETTADILEMETQHRHYRDLKQGPVP